MQEVTSSTGRTFTELNDTALDRMTWGRITHEVTRREGARDGCRKLQAAREEPSQN